MSEQPNIARPDLTPLEEAEQDSPSLHKWVLLAVSVVGIGLSLYQLYTAGMTCFQKTSPG